jgi:hypothetical protein
MTEEQKTFSAKETLDSLVTRLTELSSDAEKFDQGNASAGRRVRKGLAVLRLALQQTRFDIQEVKNNRKQQSTK